MTTGNLPDTLDELNTLRVAVMSNYILACEMEQDANDEEDYSAPGNSARLMAEIKAIDAKIRTMPKPVQAAKLEIDMDNPMSWPSLQSELMTVGLAYRMGQWAAVNQGGTHPDNIDASGFISDITRAYRRGWMDTVGSNNEG